MIELSTRLKELISLLDQEIQIYLDNGEAMDVDALLECQDKLSGYSWTLTELCAEFKRDYNFKYFTRKIMVNESAQAITNKPVKIAMNKAVLSAEVKHKYELENEIEAESYAYEADLRLKQLNRILSSVQQRISHAKRLWEMNKYQNQ